MPILIILILILNSCNVKDISTEVPVESPLVVKDSWVKKNHSKDWAVLVKIVWISMEPTLKNWKYYKATTNFSRIYDWDIVTFRIMNSEREYIKRVNWVPWDVLQIWKINWVEKIQINWNKIIDSKEWKLKRMIIKNKWVLTIPENFYLLLWDNSNNSNDSYDFWFIHSSKIHAKLIWE